MSVAEAHKTVLENNNKKKNVCCDPVLSKWLCYVACLRGPTEAVATLLFCSYVGNLRILGYIVIFSFCL